MQDNRTEIQKELLKKADQYLNEDDNKIGSLEDHERISTLDRIDMINSMLVKLAYFCVDQKDNSSQSYNKEAIYQETSTKLNNVLDMYGDGELPVISVVHFFTSLYYPCQEGYYPCLVGSYYDSLDAIYARNSAELNDLVRVQLQMDPRYHLSDLHTGMNVNNTQQQQHSNAIEEEMYQHVLQPNEHQIVQQLGTQLDHMSLL